MRESRDACAASVLGERFSFFLVRDVKGRRESQRGRICGTLCNILTNKREITSDATGVTAPTTSGGLGQ